MSGRPQLPAGPLLDLVERRATHAGMSRRHFVRDQLGEAVERNWWRWKSGQTVSHATADRICTQLGLHLDELWPETQTPPPIRRAHASRP